MKKKLFLLLLYPFFEILPHWTDIFNPLVKRSVTFVKYPIENYGNNYLIVRLPEMSYFRELKSVNSDSFFDVDKFYKISIGLKTNFTAPVEVFEVTSKNQSAYPNSN